VNGQTGKVGGKRPRDSFKVWMILIVALLVVTFVVAIGYLLWQRLPNFSLGG
jgi:nitrate reductase NapE component